MGGGVDVLCPLMGTIRYSNSWRHCKTALGWCVAADNQRSKFLITSFVSAWDRSSLYGLQSEKTHDFSRGMNRPSSSTFTVHAEYSQFAVPY